MRNRDTARRVGLKETFVIAPESAERRSNLFPFVFLFRGCAHLKVWYERLRVREWRERLRGEGSWCLPPESCRAPQGGMTPLHHASWKGNWPLVKQLLAAGVDKDGSSAVSGEGEGWGTRIGEC